MTSLKNITLEMSLKAFKRIEQDYLEKVCRELFGQWKNILKHADMVSVMLWSSDGSEILEYKRELDEEMEWAKYIGGANPKEIWDRSKDPDGISLHVRNYLYTDNPPVLTYRILKRIIETIKAIGYEAVGKAIRVGATFDPGPEFAKSDFKYKRHEEICMGNTMGKKSFVCSYAILHEDKCSYAGFPDGIPEGTPFGTFFGRQCNYFLKDLGFDYIWFSNGFGFGTETWGTTGVTFDGEKFTRERLKDTQGRILEFWKLFREECPDIRVETRGTNLTAGIDLSTDAVPLKEIYEGNFNILPPPNSPWAALNGDFGLELAGYMSKISELPNGEDYLFRFYTHDPWWMNSPWFDRYEGQPHDIYLPLAVSRINGNGEVKSPNHLNFLTIDNSLGDMPEQCPIEVIPHLLKAYEHQPDAVSPIVWVYPFREYHEIVASDEQRIEKAFYEDWFIRGAINNGFPLSTVVSTDNFVRTIRTSPEIYNGVTVVSPVPLKDSELESVLVSWMENGNKVLIYGSLSNAGIKLLDALNIQKASAVAGIMDLELDFQTDALRVYSWPLKICHEELMSDGGIDTEIKNDKDCFTRILACVKKDNEKKVAAVYRSCPEWRDGAVIWIRGTNSNRYVTGNHILTPYDEKVYFPVENFMRLALAELGMKITFLKEEPETKNPVIMIHRSKGAFYFSGYVPDTTTELKFKFQLGAPLLFGSETKLDNGYSVYRMSRSWHNECRVFVEQEENTVLSCKEICPVSFEFKRRFQVQGLRNATVRIFPQKGYEDKTEILLNSIYPHIVGEKCQWTAEDTPWGRIFKSTNVTGALIVSA